MKRFLSLALAVVTILLCVTSCQKTESDLIATADKKLTKKAYVMEVDLDFTCHASEIAEVFEQLESSETTIYVKGDSVRAFNEMNIDHGEGKNTFKTEYTVVNGVVYRNLTYTADGITREAKNKTAASDEKITELVKKLAVIGGVSVSDYAESVVEERDGDRYLVYTAPSGEACTVLDGIMLAQLENAAQSVKVDKDTVRFVIELDGKLYDNATLECEYDVVISGKSYRVEMEVELEFDYDARFDIKAPSDAGEYVDSDEQTVIG